MEKTLKKIKKFLYFLIFPREKIISGVLVKKEKIEILISPSFYFPSLSVENGMFLASISETPVSYNRYFLTIENAFDGSTILEISAREWQEFEETKDYKVFLTNYLCKKYFWQKNWILVD